MPSTHALVLFHIVFATKHRTPVLSATWRGRLHDYLGGSVKGLHGVPLAVGGVDDHVHLLVSLTPSHRLSDFVRELKKGSTQWIAKSTTETKFQWQEGYGAFSVSASQRDAVKSYIARQEAHHANKTFRDEYHRMLTKSDVVHDEQDLD